MGSHLVEDEYHVLLICPLYSDTRNKYIVTHFRRFMPSDSDYVNQKPQIYSRFDCIYL